MNFRTGKQLVWQHGEQLFLHISKNWISTKVQIDKDNIGYNQIVKTNIDVECFGVQISVRIGPKRVSKTFAQENKNEIDISWLLPLKDDNRGGPIVQNENIGINMIGGNLVVAESAFFTPTDKIKIPLA